MIKLKLDKNQKNLRKRIIEISYKNKLSHIGSCLNAVDLIDGVYSIKKPRDRFVLSAGHSAVALYAVLEKYGGRKKYDEVLCIHPDKTTNPEIEVSTGSLGQGLPISIGMAIADPSNKVYCLISDGECSEGSIWESLRLIEELKIVNLVVLISANGYGAYDPINIPTLRSHLSGFDFKILDIDGHNPQEIKKSIMMKATKPILIFARTTSEQLPFLVGQNAHYYVMNDDLHTAHKELT